MTDADFDRATASLRIKIGRARAKARRAETLQDKLAALSRVRILDEQMRNLRLNRFAADGA